MLKKEGSKVRCSTCKNVFTAYQPEPEPALVLDELLEETVTMDSSPVVVEPEVASLEEGLKADLDEALEASLEEDETVTFSLDDFPDLSEEGGREETIREAEVDRAFTDEIGDEDIQEVTLDEISDLGIEETVHMGEAMDRAIEIDEEITGEDEQEEFLEAGKADEDEDIAPPSRKKPGTSRLPTIFLVFILLIFGGGAAAYFLAPELIPKSLTESFSFLKTEKKPGVVDMGDSRLEFRGVNGSFIESNQEKQRFLIKGIVTNGYSKPRSFILIKGSILDDKGKVIKTKKVYAGNKFTETEIKEMALEQINKRLKNRFGKKRINFNIKPGRAIPFAIVFEDLPENISEFTVEAVSSSPGRK